MQNLDLLKLMQNELSSLIKSLEPHVRDFCKGLYPTEGFFISLLKAAIAKSYEFCSFTVSEEGKPNALFYSATLRGVCEDIINLKYYYSFDTEDREVVAKYMTVIDMAENIETQTKFFKANKPTQPIVQSFWIKTKLVQLRERSEILKVNINGRVMDIVHQLERWLKTVICWSYTTTYIQQLQDGFTSVRVF